MTGARLAGPAALAVIGGLLFGSWLAGGLPLLSLPFPYPPGTAWRHFVFLILLPVVSSSLLLAGGIMGVRRLRAVGRRGSSGSTMAFGVVLVAGAVAVAFSLFVVARTML